ncbi:MAG: PorT family protein, partial [Muribaculaceae bacterium]|nr:PorT family protein [Muribaculaceae bacterium]
MKKKIRPLIAAAILALAAHPAPAETHYRPHVWIGGRAGMSMGMMSFSPSVKQSWNTGTTGAVTFRYSEEKIFGVIAELGWIQRGWKENYETLPFRYNRTLTYINLPILTHNYFGSRRFKCFVNLGPEFGLYIGYKISANFDYHNPASVDGYPTKTRMT